MQTGRKIMNLRRDRSISQQDLARYCNITPSALSKIESGQNSPRGGVIFRIARNLGVTVEYLLDEEIPYPYKGLSYRQEAGPGTEPARVRTEISREEKAFLEALEESPDIVRELAYSLPEASPELIRLLHFLFYHYQVENPGPGFLERFEEILSPQPEVEEPADSSSSKSSRKTTSRKAAKKTRAGGTGKKKAAKPRRKVRSKK
ncbi:MAG: helix-turn-helix domain-containing protein [Planctomycetota bacterium]|nr:helix-turn-helix domain-containing protein [Planctomycetota bacterium]